MHRAAVHIQNDVVSIINILMYHFLISFLCLYSTCPSYSKMIHRIIFSYAWQLNLCCVADLHSLNIPDRCALSSSFALSLLSLSALHIRNISSDVSRCLCSLTYIRYLFCLFTGLVSYGTGSLAGRLTGSLALTTSALLHGFL